MNPPSEPRSSSYRELVRNNPNFRNLWFGQIVSLFGDWFNLIASASLIGALTGSGIAVGGLFVVRMMAPFLISPFAGVASDRYNRRTILIVTDVVRAVVVLGFLFVRSADTLWLFYGLTFVQLAMHGVFFPTRNAILPDIVRPEDIGAANAITGTTWSVMLAMGAAAGGLVAGGWGIYPAFVIDSATFLLSLFFIARIRYVPKRNANSDKSLRLALDEYLDGLRYLASHRSVLLIASQKACLTLFVVGGWEVVQVAMANELFVIGEGGGIGLGILYAVLGVGSGIGPLASRVFTGDRERPMRIAIAISYGAMAAGLGIAATVSSFGVVLVGSFVRALGGGTLWVFSTQLLLEAVPEHVRGRVFATEYAVLTLAMALSAGLAGWALDQLDDPIVLSLRWMSVSILLPGAVWTLSLLTTPDPRTGV